MVDNDNLITAKAFEVVQKVPAEEKHYYKFFLCVIFFIYPHHIQ